MSYTTNHYPIPTNDDNGNNLANNVMAIIIALFICSCISMCTSSCCSTSKVITDSDSIMVSKVDYKAYNDTLNAYREKVLSLQSDASRKDSVYVYKHDSTIVFIKGDTLVEYHYHDNIIYKESYESLRLAECLVDSLSISRSQNSLLLSQLDSIKSNVHTEYIEKQVRYIPKWVWYYMGISLMIIIGFFMIKYLKG